MWKKSEVWKSKKFRLLVLVELILLVAGCIGLIPGDRKVADLSTMQVSLGGGEYQTETGAYYVDGTAGFQGTLISAVPEPLSAGVYRMEITVEAEDNMVNSFEIRGTSGKFHAVRSNSVLLFSGRELQTCQFYVSGMSEEAVVEVRYGGTGKFVVSDLSIIKTNAGSRIFLTLTLLLSLLVNTLVMLYAYMGKQEVSLEKKLVWFGIPAITLIASFPLFTDYVLCGVDNSFHCMRIEMLAQTICQGVFPARIEAGWLYGQGYANSIFYCDTFLVVPALLRIIGFDMIVSYNSYVFVMNLAMALIAYISFKGIFKNSYVGMFGSLVYTLAPYHIYNVYNWSAVGEYTAMTFLPLLAWGFYLIFSEDTESENYRHYWLIPTLGFSGIIQSHVLSSEIAGAFTIVLCLIMIKKVFRKKTFLELCKVVGGTVLLNAWFIVPMFDMMLSGEYYFSHNSGVTVQKRGVLLANIFDTMQTAGSSSKFYELGLQDTEPIGVGLAILLGVGVWFFVRKRQGLVDKKLDGATKVAFAVGVIALAMSTMYFPWDRIQSWNSITGALVPMIQFTTRLTVVPTVCLSFVACTAFSSILKTGSRQTKYIFITVICGASIVLSLFQTNDYMLIRDSIMRLYSVENIGHSAVLGAEYLPIGAEMPSRYHEAVPAEGVSVISFEKENLDTRTEISVENGTGEYFVELPMLCYKGYRAEDVQTGERFEIEPGTNYEVRVQLPAGYNGTVRVRYTGMWYWRAAEAVSLLFLAAIVVCVLKRKRNKLSR